MRTMTASSFPPDPVSGPIHPATTAAVSSSFKAIEKNESD
ncbi:hypothetical protein BH23ACT12_BH23ACT12_07560 [soil metagenome]